MSTPGREPLTRTRILETAIALLDRDGAKALSMRRLGAELGVEAMSLYNHVANKQDVLDGMAGLLISRMTDYTVGGDDWQAMVARICRAFRTVMREHPEVFVLTAGRPLVSGEDHAQFQATMVRLRDAGFSQELAEDLFSSCAALVRGFAIGDEAYRDAPVAAGIAWDEDRAFERGLAAMIDGFSRMLAREQG